METDDIQYPKKIKKFRIYFIKLLEQKAKATITTKNRFKAISDSESKSEIEQTSSKTSKKGKATPNLPIRGKSVMQNQVKSNNKTITKTKESIPPNCY